MNELPTPEEFLRNLYRVIEADFIESWRYVEPTEDNLNTYSIQFYRLHQDICRVIDSLCKLMLDEYGMWPEGKIELGIRDYRPLKSMLRLPTEELEFKRGKISVAPLDGWEQESPRWWRTHTDLKHWTGDFFPTANMRNVIHSLGALYYLLNHPKAIERLGPMGTDVFVAIY